MFKEVYSTNPHLLALCYPIFFPYGEEDWSPDIKSKVISEKLKKITLKDYMCTLLAIRRKTFNAILHGGKLLMQFIIDIYLQVLNNYIFWAKLNQNKLKRKTV